MMELFEIILAMVIAIALRRILYEQQIRVSVRSLYPLCVTAMTQSLVREVKNYLEAKSNALR